MAVTHFVTKSQIVWKARCGRLTPERVSPRTATRLWAHVTCKPCLDRRPPAVDHELEAHEELERLVRRQLALRLFTQADWGKLEEAIADLDTARGTCQAKHSDYGWPCTRSYGHIGIHDFLPARTTS